LRATKMLINALKDAEKRAGAAPPAEPAPFTAADEEVMATFIARLRQSWEEELQQKAPSGIIARMMTSPINSPGPPTTRCCGSILSALRSAACAS